MADPVLQRITVTIRSYFSVAEPTTEAFLVSGSTSDVLFIEFEERSAVMMLSLPFIPIHGGQICLNACIKVILIFTVSVR